MVGFRADRREVAVEIDSVADALPAPTSKSTLRELVDPVHPSAVFVRFESGMIYISAPLRNVGQGLAVIDDGGVEVAGVGIGPLEHRTVQRYHVPVGETTRSDLIRRHVATTQFDAAHSGFSRSPTWIAGQQRSVATIQIVCLGDDVHGPWVIERVEQAGSTDQAAEAAHARS